MSANAPVYGSANGRDYNGAMMGKGKEGERVILSWLRANPAVIEVDDLRDLRPMQKADVDCAIYNDDGTVCLVEIKSDDWLVAGGNVAFEYLRINHTAAPDKACVLGWTARTPAKYVMYYATKEQTVYVFRADKLRQAFQKFTDSQRPQHGEWFTKLNGMKMRWISTDAIKSTLIVCIPLIVFPADAYKVYDVSGYV